MATINITLAKDDVLNVNVASTKETSEVDDSKEVIDALYDKLKADLSAYNRERNKKEHKAWWYEVFADFNEDFDGVIYPQIKDKDYQAQYVFCLGYMFLRDTYYFSDDYYNDLNKMLKSAEFKE